MKKINVTVVRSAGEQRYAVPVHEGMSVMDVLDYIYSELDPTLAYFSHEACRQTACGKCLVKVNGKNCLACGTPCGESDLHLAPWSDRVVRDLLCE
ncbi:MAG: hypothetical protein IJD03_03410 [Clostridia bacterium]|nr:hypothetical protein [Clostridia bacterium]